MSCLEGTHDGRLLFTGASDGLVLAHDLRMRDGSTVLWHHNACVQSLSYEDPWLATASADGTIVMMSTEGCMGHRLCNMRGSASNSYGGALLASRDAAGSRIRQFQTQAGPAYCVDLAEQYLVCGSESETVRIWDFTKANEVAARAAAAKAARAASKAAKAAQPPQQQVPLPQQVHRRGRQAWPQCRDSSGSSSNMSTSPPMPRQYLPLSVGLGIGSTSNGAVSTSSTATGAGHVELSSSPEMDVQCLPRKAGKQGRSRRKAREQQGSAGTSTTVRAPIGAAATDLGDTSSLAMGSAPGGTSSGVGVAAQGQDACMASASTSNSGGAPPSLVGGGKGGSSRSQNGLRPRSSAWSHSHQEQRSRHSGHGSVPGRTGPQPPAPFTHAPHGQARGAGSGMRTLHLTQQSGAVGGFVYRTSQPKQRQP